MSSTVHSLLQQYWNFEEFRPFQEEIIEHVCKGHHTLALLPTGGGKSLCYQVPALLLEGVTLVISPLIALMKDQVKELKNRGIDSEALVDVLHRDRWADIMERAQSGELKIIYLSPERLHSAQIADDLLSLPIKLIAIDEAHCISQWGHDFRPDFLKIGTWRKQLPQVPVLALTATATPAVVQDIQQQLGISDMKVFRSGFSRKNIELFMVYEEEKNKRLVEELPKAGSAIVYCRSRARTAELQQILWRQGIKAVHYHAGLSVDERDDAQQLWMNHQASVMIATSAFGMGINKADVRKVVHYDLPESIEAWYQELGRAGRDGQPAQGICLWNQKDISRLKALPDYYFPCEDILLKVYQSVMEYLQLPAPMEINNYFPFDIAEMCRRFHLPQASTINAMKNLEMLGFWTFSQRNQQDQVKILANRQGIDSLEKSFPQLYAVCVGLIRKYSNLFYDFVHVDIWQLCRMLNRDKSQVIKDLHRLDQLGVLHFRAANREPMLYIHHYRTRVQQLQLNHQRLNHLRHNFSQRINAIIHLATDPDQCIEQNVLKYFGEDALDRCGRCSYCLSVKFHKSKTEQRQFILEYFNAHPKVNLTALRQALPHIPKEQLNSLLQQLIDEEKIQYTQSGGHSTFTRI